MGQLSELLLDWTTAVIELDTTVAHKLLEKEPELLWTPIPESLNDIDHLVDDLVNLNKLGTSFQPVSAIQFTLIYYNELKNDNEDRIKFLTYLIEQSSLHDLDTRYWGECNNTTLHLVCFLGHQKIVQLLIEKGVSVTPSNEFGFIPRDVVNTSTTTTGTIIQLLNMKTSQKKSMLDRSKSSALRPNYSTPDRFKLLRELAEESTVIEQQQNKKPMAVTLDRQKSDVRYFRKGRVKETQQKVLTEEEVVELEKQRKKRQLEVAQLVKKSAVKNNPLFKKLEKRSFTSPTPSPSTSTSNLNLNVATDDTSTNLDGAMVLDALNDNVEERPKRNSKVISSLQKKSYVSTSIFVQADEIEPKHQTPSPPLPSMNGTVVDEDTTFITQEDSCVTQQSLGDDQVQCTTILNDEPSEIEYSEKEEYHIEQQSTDDDDFYEVSNEELIESLEIRTIDKVQIPPDNTEKLDSLHNDIMEQHPITSSDEEEEYSENVKNLQISTNINNEKLDPMEQHSITSSDEEEDYSEQVRILQISTDNITEKLDPVEQHPTTSSDEEDYSDNDNDDEFEESTPVQFATRIVSPIYKSVVLLSEEEKLNHLEERRQPTSIEQRSPTAISNIDKQQLHQEHHDNSNVITKNFNNSKSSSLLETENISPTPVRPQRSELRRPSNIIKNEPKEKKRMSGSQKAAWTMSMSSWAAILDREFNLDEIDQEKKFKQQQQLKDQIIEETRPSIDYLGDGSSKLQLSEDEIEVIFQGSQSSSPTSPLSSTTLHFKDIPRPPSTTPLPRAPSTTPLPRVPPTTPLPRAPQIEQAFPRLQSQKSISRKPISATIPTTTTHIKPTRSVPSNINIKHRSDHGKLYLHVNDISDILLPLPKERAYVRCVVSDGRFEYMSRYEILSQNINFDYECVIDTHPNMIITISLHVRPDYVMKSRKPFSRLFSSKKKKESLSGYVNKEDGAIGQARFALAHMLPVCMETTYLAGFHCFNAWYSRSFKERHRQKKQDPDQDVLKVVGNFDVEMFYLPVQDYNKPFPRNLRECDLAIKQLHKSVRDSSEKYHTF